MLNKSKLSKQKLKELELHDKEIAKNYKNVREKNKFSKHYQGIWIKEMLGILDNEPKKILDYGCGTSILFPYLR